MKSDVEMTGYVPPVSLYQSFEDKVLKMQENEITSKITYTLGVEVDREELIRALRYDRDQYACGFRNGVSMVCDKLKALLEEIGGEIL